MASQAPAVPEAGVIVEVIVEGYGTGPLPSLRFQQTVAADVG